MVVCGGRRTAHRPARRAVGGLLRPTFGRRVGLANLRMVGVGYTRNPYWRRTTAVFLRTYFAAAVTGGVACRRLGGRADRAAGPLSAWRLRAGAPVCSRGPPAYCSSRPWHWLWASGAAQANSLKVCTSRCGMSAHSTESQDSTSPVAPTVPRQRTLPSCICVSLLPWLPPHFSGGPVSSEGRKQKRAVTTRRVPRRQLFPNPLLVRS